MRITHVEDNRGVALPDFHDAPSGNFQVSPERSLLFFEDLFLLMQAGISLTDSLEIMAQGESNRSFQRIIVYLALRVRNGLSLGDAMGYYPGIFSLIIRSVIVASDGETRFLEVLPKIIMFLKKDIINKEQHWRIVLHCPVRRWRDVFRWNSVADFSNKLWILMTADIAISDAMGILEKSPSKRNKEVLRLMREQLELGVSLQDILASYKRDFPLLFTAVIGCSERSDSIERSLEIMRDAHEERCARCIE